MVWGPKNLSFDIVFGLDLFGAMVIFGKSGVSISGLAGRVRDGHEAQLNLKPWQIYFLRWLGPRLSQKHCAEAVLGDIRRLEEGLRMMGKPVTASVAP